MLKRCECPEGLIRVTRRCCVPGRKPLTAAANPEALGRPTLCPQARSSCPARYLGAAKVTTRRECSNPPRLGFHAPAGASSTYLDQWIIEDAPLSPSPPPPKRSSPPPPKKRSPPAPPPPPPQPRWVPAGAGSQGATPEYVISIAPGYDPVDKGPLFAASIYPSQTGAVYYSTEETVSAQQGGGRRRRLLGSAAGRQSRRLAGGGGWTKYLGQDYGATSGYVSMQVDPAGLPAVAYSSPSGVGILKVSNGTDWIFGCSPDGQFGGSIFYPSLAITPAAMMGTVGMQQAVAFQDGSTAGPSGMQLAVRYCEGGQWKTFPGTPYNRTIRDGVFLGIVPWAGTNSSDSWTVVVASTDAATFAPVMRYFNRTTSDWNSIATIPAKSYTNNLKVRYDYKGFEPLVALSDQGLGLEGTLFAPSTPKRRRLLSASGAASNQSTSFDFSFSWSNLPPGQTSFSSDTAYEIDTLPVPGAGAVIVAYSDMSFNMGGKARAKILINGTLVDLGQPGFSAGRVYGTAISASPGLGSSSDWLYCAFRDGGLDPNAMSIHKLNLTDWLAWYKKTHP